MVRIRVVVRHVKLLHYAAVAAKHEGDLLDPRGEARDAREVGFGGINVDLLLHPFE